MKLTPGRLWPVAVCCTLFVAVASGQNAPAVSTKAASANTYVREGQKLIDAHKPAEALKALENAAALDPDDEPEATPSAASPPTMSASRLCRDFMPNSPLRALRA